MAFLQGGQHVVGDGFAAGDAVLDGQPVNDAEFHLAGLHLVCQQVFQHPLGLRRDDGADAVAAADADDQPVQRFVVGKLLHRLHFLHPEHLALQHVQKFLCAER